MIGDLKMIEKMDEILDLTRGKNTPEQKLKDIEVALRNTIKEAEGRVEENEQEYAPDHRDPYDTWLENAKIERFIG